MSEGNLGLVRQGFAHWQTGDYDSLLDFFLTTTSSDVALHSRFGELSGQPYRGHEGVRAWLAEIQENFERFEPWLDDVRDVGDDRVVAIGGISFRASGSGVDMAEPLGWVFEFRNEQLHRLLFYAYPSEALEAVGLAE